MHTPDQAREPKRETVVAALGENPCSFIPCTTDDPMVCSQCGARWYPGDERPLCQFAWMQAQDRRKMREYASWCDNQIKAIL